MGNNQILTMTPQEKRIAIADACPFVERYGKGERLWRWQGRRIYFDPFNDLNACHEMEKVLTPEQWGIYEDILAASVEFAWHATAIQRADAFLITIGKLKKS
jgi:hypothetical protein